MRKAIFYFAIMVLIIVATLVNEDPAVAAEKLLLLGSFELKAEQAVTPANAYNAALATDRLNGTSINPGQIFSFNKTIGVRSPSRGFIVAELSTRSKTPAYGYGGGVCMTASILHQAVKASHLPVIERHDHVADTGYLPLGEDAAISWGIEDYKFKNNLPNPLIIRTHTDEEIIHISIYEQFISPAIYVQDKKLIFNQEPFLKDGLTYVPLAETVSLLNLTPAEYELLFKSADKITATTYLPGDPPYISLRTLVDILGKKISWNGELQEIRIGG